MRAGRPSSVLHPNASDPDLNPDPACRRRPPPPSPRCQPLPAPPLAPVPAAARPPPRPGASRCPLHPRCGLGQLTSLTPAAVIQRDFNPVALQSCHNGGKLAADSQEDGTPPSPAPPLLSPPPLDNSGSNPPAPHASVVLETSCPSEGPAEGDRCVGTCHPPPVPPRPHPLLPRVADKDNCPASDGMMDVVGLLDSLMEVPAGDRKGERLPFQIFPDPVEVVLGTEEGSLGCPQEKERLPSIVVEPTDVSEVESGELRWPPEDMDFQDEEDLFLEQCVPPANIADWGDDADEEEEPDEEGEGEESPIIPNTQLHASLIVDEDFRDDTPTLLHDSAPALN
ncbi:hypothetical protein SKAU_G00089520 [Synaphobranchus kaupii]|uniref:LBH domain-containing protein n=1 Tax=Synaphobranchus kaupii TaxID=118154 RepID=A0A9Q1FWZ0_SYNKA|nr:hypothetical protein SKAU_G00089520 [Synaphobranchus kaupii]